MFRAFSGPTKPKHFSGVTFIVHVYIIIAATEICCLKFLSCFISNWCCTLTRKNDVYTVDVSAKQNIKVTTFLCFITLLSASFIVKFAYQFNSQVSPFRRRPLIEDPLKYPNHVTTWCGAYRTKI